jgi:hypothetical protein
LFKAIVGMHCLQAEEEMLHGLIEKRHIKFANITTFSDLKEFFRASSLNIF